MALPPRLLRAGLLVGVTDGLFATVQSVVILGRTFARLWQGVASVVLGKAAFDGGVATAALGLLMHFTVAFTWSGILLVTTERSPRLRGVLDSRFGPLKVAVVWGPFIWLAMSLVVIPTFAHRRPAVTSTYFTQLVGHIVFVGLPMAWAIRRRPERWRVSFHRDKAPAQRTCVRKVCTGRNPVPRHDTV